MTYRMFECYYEYKKSIGRGRVRPPLSLYVLLTCLLDEWCPRYVSDVLAVSMDDSHAWERPRSNYIALSGVCYYGASAGIGGTTA